MKEVDNQVEGIHWGDASDLDYSDASLSDSDGSEGEVPIVGDVKATDPSSKPVLGAGAIRANNPKFPGLSYKASSIATRTLKDSSFTRGWKPVIDGKIQVSGEGEAVRARSSSIQSAPNGIRTSSSQKSSGTDNTSASPATNSVMGPKKDGNESDSDVWRVPEMAAKGVPSSSSSARPQGQPTVKRKRGGASADKEHKRLKRLLRNRVSAQQARERKKQHVSNLEKRSKENSRRIEEQEDKINKLMQECTMLRQLLKTAGRAKSGGPSHKNVGR